MAEGDEGFWGDGRAPGGHGQRGSCLAMPRGCQFSASPCPRPLLPPSLWLQQTCSLHPQALDQLWEGRWGLGWWSVHWGQASNLCPCHPELRTVPPFAVSPCERGVNPGRCPRLAPLVT